MNTCCSIRCSRVESCTQATLLPKQSKTLQKVHSRPIRLYNLKYMVSIQLVKVESIPPSVHYYITNLLPTCCRNSKNPAHFFLCGILAIGLNFLYQHLFPMIVDDMKCSKSPNINQNSFSTYRSIVIFVRKINPYEQRTIRIRSDDTATQFLRADRHELYINRAWLQTPEISRFGGSRVFSLFCNHEVCGYGVQKKGIISKSGSLQDLNPAVPIFKGRKCDGFAHLLPFFVFCLSNDCKNSRGN